MHDNEARLLVDRLSELFLKPAIEEMISYLTGNLIESDYNDLVTQKDASRLLPISQQRLSQLCRSKRIGSYTRYKLVRLSEIKAYLKSKGR